ncbi:transcription elongation factor [Novymonas esmeraldas]|uniref:Transcription elongation factor n=1 Tax=Novymonas esmeraldas TaxID=1808958 RepID=A0AAW0EQN2_9TRYP
MSDAPQSPALDTSSLSTLSTPTSLAEPPHAAAAALMKRPRVAEPVTHFLTPSSLGGCSDSSSHRPPAECTAVTTSGDATPGGVPAPPRQLPRVEGATTTTPRSPYADLPRKLPRKTPVSTPASSLATPTLTTPPTAAAPSPPLTSAATAAAAGKRATLHQRWAALLHSVFMKERQSHESARVLELCGRIIAAIPGDAEQSKDAFQTLFCNIKDVKNAELRRKVVDGEVLVERLVTMDDRELANPELRRQIEEKMEVRSKDTNLSEIKKAMRTSNSTLFKCNVCGARDSSWEQRQTRSGDEPMTVIITCNRCNTQWRKY